MKRKLPVFGLLGATLSTMAIAQPRYVSSTLPEVERPEEAIIADLNGNRRQDILLQNWSPDSGRELLVFQQQADGRYPGQPTRRIPVATDAVAMLTGDVGPLPGDEILLLTPFTVSALSVLNPDHPESLLEWRHLASVPRPERLDVLPPLTDLDGDGAPDLLLPGPEDYGLFSANEDGEFILQQRITTDNTALAPSAMPDGRGRFSTRIRVNKRDGLQVDMVPESSSAFTDFIRDQRNREMDTRLLDSEQDLPAAVPARLTGNDAADIVFMDVGDDLRARFNRLSRTAGGNWPSTPQWRSPLDAEGEYRLIDLDGDGLEDMVRMSDDDGEVDIRLYRNRNGTFRFDQPDQLMRFSGYNLRLSAVDIDGDGTPELSVNFYTIPVTSALRDTRINRVQLLFTASTDDENDRLFENRPASRNEDSFSGDAVRGLTEPLNLEADLDGDGRIDVLAMSGDGRLTARAVDEDLNIAQEPFWEYVPDRTVLRLEVRNLNDDGTPDFILYHSTTTTILVSAP